MYNLQKLSDILQKLCSKYSKIFKVCLVHFGILCIKSLKQVWKSNIKGPVIEAFAMLPKFIVCFFMWIALLIFYYLPNCRCCLVQEGENLSRNYLILPCLRDMSKLYQNSGKRMVMHAQSLIYMVALKIKVYSKFLIPSYG